MRLVSLWPTCSASTVRATPAARLPEQAAQDKLELHQRQLLGASAQLGEVQRTAQQYRGSERQLDGEARAAELRIEQKRKAAQSLAEQLDVRRAFLLRAVSLL